MTEKDEIIWEAEFNPKVRTYWLLSGAIVMLVTVVGIPLIPFWYLFGNALTARYLSHMSCRLTTKNLQVSKGMFVRTEKTVPLDKITDVGLVHGPIMRHFDLQAISVETAGQSTPGALISLVGIVDTIAFREAVLAQRDLVAAHSLGEGTATSAGALTDGNVRSDQLLTEIRDALIRMEGRLPDALKSEEV